MNQTEKKIWEYLRTVHNNGYTLVQREFGNEETKTCCILTAIVIANSVSFKFIISDSGDFKMWPVRNAAAVILRKSYNWIVQFMNGWDNHVPAMKLGRYKKAWEMGRRLHKKWMN